MSGTEYPKIETLYDRDEEDKRYVVVTKLRRPEFKNIRLWSLTEKIHGENTRISLFDNGNVEYGGKTDQAQLTPEVLEYLKKTFPAEKMKAAFWLPNKSVPKVAVMYGETYGAGSTAHGSKLYRKDLSFRLFDCLVDIYWLKRDDLEDVARKLGIKCVPLLATIDFLPTDVVDIEYILDRNKHKLVVSEEGGFESLKPEGIVAKAEPMLFYRDGEKLKRVMWKLKISDFKRKEPIKLKWKWKLSSDNKKWKLVKKDNEEEIIGSVEATRGRLVTTNSKEETYLWEVVAECEKIGYKEIQQNVDDKTLGIMTTNMRDVIQKGVEYFQKYGKKKMD